MSVKCKLSRSSVLLLSLMAVTLLLPGLTGYFEDSSERSQIENRTLSEFPDISLFMNSPKVYFGALDTYLNDNLGFAVSMSRVYRRIRFYVFGDNPTSRVSKGEDGFVFLNSHDGKQLNDVFYGLCVNQEAIMSARDRYSKWRQVVQRFEQRGYRTILAVTPSKPVLYADKLPSSIPVKVREACMGYKDRANAMLTLRAKANAEGWRMFYPFEEFYGLRDRGNFFPKENFHWRGHSTHVFARGLLRRLGIPVPEGFSASAFENEVDADIESLVGFKRKITITDYDYKEYRARNMWRKPQSVKRYYKRARDFSVTETKRPLTRRTALVLSNSFGANLIAHIAPAYRSVLHININGLAEDEGKKFFSEFIDLVGPDDIILLMHDSAATVPLKKMHSHLGVMKEIKRTTGKVNPVERTGNR